jgi:hypothetical protein
MRGNKLRGDTSIGKRQTKVAATDRLARVEKSIADVQSDCRPPGIKQSLLAALRKERDALKAAAHPPETAMNKPRR